MYVCVWKTLSLSHTYIHINFHIQIKYNFVFLFSFCPTKSSIKREKLNQTDIDSPFHVCSDLGWCTSHMLFAALFSAILQTVMQKQTNSLLAVSIRRVSGMEGTKQTNGKTHHDRNRIRLPKCTNSASRILSLVILWKQRQMPAIFVLNVYAFSISVADKLRLFIF